MANSQTIPVQLETVRKELPRLFDMADNAQKRVVAKMPATKVSSWTAGSGAVQGFRIPIMQYPGGNFGAVSLDDGDLGTGSMPTYQYMAIGYTALRLNYLIPTLTMQATNTSEQATVNVWKDTLKKAIPNFAAYTDALFHTAGDGILATGNGVGSPSGSNPTYNLDANFGPQRLILGQVVDVYDSTGATNKGTCTVASFDPVAKTVSLTGTVSSPANTDILAVSGLSPTLAVGSTRLGLYTFQNSATSGSTLGLSRSTVPELVTPNITASASLSPAFALALKDQIIQRRDEAVVKNLLGISHQAQRAAAFFTGDAIAEVQYKGSSVDSNFDRVPKNNGQDDDFTFGTVKHFVSKRQNRSRLDWIVQGNWGRVNLTELDFFKRPDGSYVFEDRSSTGTVKTGMFFSLIASDNIYNADPGAGGMLTSLTIPAGY